MAVHVIPAILAKSADDLYAKIRLLEPHVSRVHIDVIDGQFAPNTTVSGFQELASLDTKLKFDVHLMVHNPLTVLDSWYAVKKADHFFMHAEAQGDTVAAMAQARAHGRWAGLAANPETDIPTIDHFLPGCDSVLLMGVHPGFTGAQFLPSTLEKVQELHRRHPDLHIGVDGGMNPETAKQVVAAGATIIVSSSYILNSPDIPTAIEDLNF